MFLTILILVLDGISILAVFKRISILLMVLSLVAIRSHKLETEGTVSNSCLALLVIVDELIWTFEVLGMGKLGVQISAFLPKTKSVLRCSAPLFGGMGRKGHPKKLNKWGSFLKSLLRKAEI